MKQVGPAPLLLMLTGALSACTSTSTPETSTRPGSPAALTPQGTAPTEWIKGMDVSEARFAESKGVVFKDRDGTAKPSLQIVKDHQYTWVRVRLMVDPNANGDYALAQDLPYVKAVMLDAKKQNLKVLLDFHYSHWWADPGNQWLPSRWSGQNVDRLATSVYTYTKDVITQLRAQGTAPDMVQIGNEINGGMLWEVGRISEKSELVSSTRMKNFVRLTNAGAYGVQDGSGGKATMPPIMVHIAKHGGAAETVAWYKRFIDAGGWVDTIGLSYYPMWHGDFNNLKATIQALRSNFSWANVYLAEVAYYWDRNQGGYTNLPYPQTPQGQYDYLRALSPVAKDAGASGIFYWGGFWSQSPKWLKADGWNDDDASRRSLFDDNAQATLAIDGLNAPVPANTAPTFQPLNSVTVEATGPGGANVTFDTQATDAEDAAGPAVTCDPASGTPFALGTTTVNCTATDSAGATSKGSFTVKVQDTTAPAITVTGPEQGARYKLDTSAVATYGCTDVVALAKCTGSIPNGAALDTSSVGPKTLSVTATDAAGNTATVTRSYAVEYTFGGFFQPVDNLPVVNSVKAGSAVPIKFSLSGDHGLNVLAAGSPTSAAMACGTANPVDAIEETVTSTGSDLSYDAASDQYKYVWKTDKSWTGTCRQLVVKLADGTEHRANFQLK